MSGRDAPFVSVMLWAGKYSVGETAAATAGGAGRWVNS